MPAEALTDRLAALPLFASVPGSELEWLVAHSEVRTYTAGTILHPTDAPVVEMSILLSGRVGLFTGKSGESRKIIEAGAGHVLGVIPYSRFQRPPGAELVEEDIVALEIHQRDTKPVGQGTGLGLDLTRRIVQLHGGDVEFTTQPGRTVFRVRLPVAGARAIGLA